MAQAPPAAGGVIGSAIRTVVISILTTDYSGTRPQGYRRRPTVPSGAVCIMILVMCRNIKLLFNFDPPATTDEVQASSLQFVRKLSGMNKPSKANEEVFYLAVERVAAAAQEMLNTLSTSAPPRDREVEAAKARERSAARFGPRA
jgi:hypothetical protein